MSKNVQFREQQRSIIQDLESILDLQAFSQHILLELDQNKDVQEKIVNLIPRIREAYNCNNIKAVTDTERLKRPWLSIMKTILKPKYQIVTTDHHIKQEPKDGVKLKPIHTKIYTFVPYEKSPPPSMNNSPDKSDESSPCTSTESSPANSKESSPANSTESSPANSKESSPANSKESSPCTSKESSPQMKPRSHRRSEL